MTTVTGIIDNPDPVRSFIDFPPTFTGRTIAPGVPTQLLVRGAKNTGNVPQNVTVTVGNASGIIITDAHLEVGDDMTQSLTATVNPGFFVNLYVTVLAPPHPDPADDGSYSFSVATNWQ